MGPYQRHKSAGQKRPGQNIANHISQPPRLPSAFQGAADSLPTRLWGWYELGILLIPLAVLG